MKKTLIVAALLLISCDDRKNIKGVITNKWIDTAHWEWRTHLVGKLIMHRWEWVGDRYMVWVGNPRDTEWYSMYPNEWQAYSIGDTIDFTKAGEE